MLYVKKIEYMSCLHIKLQLNPKISGFNQYRKSDKTASTIYEDLEFLIKRTDGWKNNFEELSTTKVDEHISSGYSMSTIWTFDGIENKYDVYRGEVAWKFFVNS